MLIALKSGSLKLLEGSGTVLACTGIALPLRLYYITGSLLEDLGVPGTTSVMTAVLQATLESERRESIVKVYCTYGTLDSTA